MANAIVGTLILIGIACAIGLPIGIGAGMYLADYRGARLATIVRFLADVLNGLPSIVSMSSKLLPMLHDTNRCGCTSAYLLVMIPRRA